MNNTPNHTPNHTLRANRLHIGIFGRRNAGKSSLLNVLTNQDVSIVSDIAGTTTDPVEKTMEFLPLGPVVFIDTAGIDDEGALGEMRVAKTQKVLDRTDIAIIVCDHNGWSDEETLLYKEFEKRNIPVLGVINKTDIEPISTENLQKILEYIKTPIQTSLKSGRKVVSLLKEQLITSVPDSFINTPSLLGDLIEEDSMVVLVVPIDKEAPKGRLILPQVQTIRDILDNGCSALVVKESELIDSLKKLREKPELVVTDSQAFKEVDEIVDKDIPLTSFSILFARLKGDLNVFYEGAKAIDDLKDGDKVLIAESCSHHQIEDDIARVKIPRWIKKKTGKDIEFVYHSSHDFVQNTGDFALIIHCGACMTNRREILSRIMKAQESNTPITNYGITIAHCIGILERAMAPFRP